MKLIEYFGFYRSIGRRSALHGVPIGELDNVRLLFAKAGKKVKFRFGVHVLITLSVHRTPNNRPV